MREKQHISDRGAIREDHYVPVYAESAPGIRRQTIFQCHNVIRIIKHRLFIPLRLGLSLITKSLRLVLGIIQL